MDGALFIKSTFKSINTILQELLLVIQLSFDILINLNVLHRLIFNILFV